MKVILFLFVFFTFQSVVLAGEIELQINGIKLGTSESVTLRKIGKPYEITQLEVNECANGFQKTMKFSGLTIDLLGNDKGKDFEAYSFEVISPKWIVSGIRIGSDKNTLVSKFGEPLEKAEENGLQKWFYVNKGNNGFANFYFQNNKLIRITWESTVC